MDSDEYFIKRMKSHEKTRLKFDEVYQKYPSCSVYEKEPWTFLKLVLISDYIDVYSNVAKYHFKKIAYFDFFSGPGINYIEKLDLYVGGSPFLAVNNTRKGKEFDDVVLFELDENKCKTLEFVVPTAEVHCLDCNCAAALSIVRDVMKRNKHFLAFIDPEGIEELSWKTLQNLFILNGDIMLNYPYSAVARIHGSYFGNIKDEVKDRFEFLLSNFFGSDDWKEIPPKKQGDSLLDLYISKLRKYYQTLEIIKLGQESGGFKIHIIFGTKKESPKWFDAVKNAKTHVLNVNFTNLKTIAEILRGKQSQLGDFM